MRVVGFREFLTGRESSSVDKQESKGIFVDCFAVSEAENRLTKLTIDETSCNHASFACMFGNWCYPFPVSLYLAISKRATLIAKRSMSGTSTTTSTTIIKIETTVASGEGRNS
jgi:hypothetical protein